MGRVVIVSNRVVAPKKAAQAGGVAVAIADVLKRRQGLWFGWSGTIEENAADSDVAHVEKVRSGGLVATLPISQAEYNGYYLGYSNSVLWPVFHNRVDLAQFEAGYYDLYRNVNARFARSLKALLQPDDLIWIHDYHFVSFAKELRALGVENRIGFFLHIPFPPAQAFLTVPEHLELAHALAAYDLVGLQTTTDVGNMIDYLQHGASGRLLPDGRVRVGDRVVAVASFPVGIDVGYFENPGDAEHVALQSSNNTLRRMVGVDRLDYTKGLPQKFRAFGRFLERYPDYHRKVILTQIAAPTRESVEAYTDVRKELESLAGSINGMHSDLDWVPIHYINRSIARSKLPATYLASHVALVTPLRDGMNLVAKEYVAAQNPADPGVLILSRFAGAAEAMTEALIVNPYNVDEIADAIRQALEMPLVERQRRHASMLVQLQAGSATHWCDAFLAYLARDPEGDLPSMSAAHASRMLRAMNQLSSSAKGGDVGADTPLVGTSKSTSTFDPYSNHLRK
jgi:trehalose 6-phosphate synthase